MQDIKLKELDNSKAIRLIELIKELGEKHSSWQLWKDKELLFSYQPMENYFYIFVSCLDRENKKKIMQGFKFERNGATELWKDFDYKEVAQKVEEVFDAWDLELENNSKENNA